MTETFNIALRAVSDMASKYAPKWTPEHEFKLMLLWGDKKTCQEIADILNEDGLKVSRNAVSAKAKRLRALGLPVAERGSPILKHKKESTNV